MSGFRKRRRRHDEPNNVRFLTFSCFRRQPLFLGDDAKDAFADQLMLARSRLALGLIAWVVMPEHIHLLLMPPGDVAVAKILMAIKRPFAAKMLGAWRQANDPRLAMTRGATGRERFWQAGGGYDRNIFSEDELREKVRYIHENPVRRGLVARPEAWAWSSVRAYQRLETKWSELDRT